MKIPKNKQIEILPLTDDDDLECEVCFKLATWNFESWSADCYSCNDCLSKVMDCFHENTYINNDLI